MKAIILAAGRGSRMGRSTDGIPKCMMTLCGKTLLDRCVESIVGAGFKRSDIGIVTGYKSEKISVEGVRYFHNADWAVTNMFYSLTMADEWLRAEPCVVAYSDIVFHPNVIKKLTEDDSELAITYYTEFWELWEMRFDNPLEDLETFRTDGEWLTEIGGKPVGKDEIQGQYMGLLRFTPSAWTKVTDLIGSCEREGEEPALPKPVGKLDMTTLLQCMIKRGHKIKAIKTSLMWLECDNEEDIRTYEKEKSLRF